MSVIAGTKNPNLVISKEVVDMLVDNAKNISFEKFPIYMHECDDVVFDWNVKPKAPHFSNTFPFMEDDVKKMLLEQTHVAFAHPMCPKGVKRSDGLPYFECECFYVPGNKGKFTIILVVDNSFLGKMYWRHSPK